MRSVLMILGLFLCLANWLRGDVVNLKNGDRLTGTVVSLELNALKVSTAMAGDVTVPLGNIASFQTDGPVALVQKDRTVIRMRVVKYENGRFELAPAGVAIATAPASTAPVQPGSASAPAPAAPTQPAMASTPTPATSTQPIPAVQRDITTIPADQILRIGPVETKWKGNITAGAIISQGNTESESFNAGFELGRRGDFDRILIQGDYIYSRETDQSTGDKNTSADRWSNQDKYDYFLSPKWYAYAGTRFEHDRVANLYLRATPGIGVGYQWIETDRTKFNTELGATWVYERHTHPSESNDFLAARIAWHLTHKLSSNAEFIHNFEILPSVTDTSDYIVNTDAGLRLRVTGHLFTEAKALFIYDSTPAEGKEKLDQQFRLNLGYDF